MSALSTGLLVGAIVTFIGAAVAWILIEKRVASPVAAADEPAELDREPARELTAA